MLLAPILAGRFNSTIRERGYQYFRQRRVTIQHGSSSEVGAQVRGSELYQVVLRWTGTELAVLCDCPFFIDQDQPCKHLWAAILAADDKSYLFDAVSAGVKRLDTESLLKEFSELDTVDAVEAPSPRRKSIPAFKPPPKPPAWKAQLSSIFAAPEPRAWESRWPADAEILFIVDVARSRVAGNLVLSLESREPRKSGEWKNAKPLSLRRSMVSSLPVAEDREILSMLIGGGRNYDYGRYDTYEPVSASYSVTPELAKTVIPKVVRTGRCYLPHDKDDAAMSPLVWDDGDAWKFALEMSKVPHQTWVLLGRFHRGVERIDVAAPLLVTPGGFLITTDRVAPLAEDAAFPWITSLRKDKLMTVPAEEFIRRFLQHVTPPGLQRIRYYGFLANCHRTAKLTLCRQLLATACSQLLPPPPDCRDLLTALTSNNLRLCPQCGKAILIRMQFFPPRYGRGLLRVDSS